MRRSVVAASLGLCACGSVDELGGMRSTSSEDGSKGECGVVVPPIESSTGSGSSTGFEDPSAYELDSGADGCVFACPEPTSGGGGGVSIECDVWTQDCPDGEKCMPWSDDGGSSWNATRCSPLDPHPSGPGEPCMVSDSAVSGIDTCALGSMCWNVGVDSMMGTCAAMCAGSEANPVCDDPATSCTITNEGTLILCLVVCDPLLQDCAEGEVCVPVDDEFVCVPDASEAGGAYGDPCEYLNVCDPGLFCASNLEVPGCAGSFGCCSPFCDLSSADADASCPGFAEGQLCMPWYDAGTGPPGRADIGACAVPT